MYNPGTNALVLILSQAAVNQLGYIERDRNPTINPQLQMHTITSMESPLALQERVENVGQRPISLSLWANYKTMPSHR